MANIIRVLFDRLITWLDFPPPQPKVGVADVNWEFLGDILGELATLSQKEIQDFAQQDFLTENEIKSLIATWVTPVFNRLTSESQQKVIASLDYYLCTDSDKINWVFPSFNIPLRIISHKAFFKLIRETLTNSPLPKSINTSLFHENNHRSFTNTLFSNLKRNALTTSSPIRKGVKGKLKMS